jgi:hypothetical protein
LNFEKAQSLQIRREKEVRGKMKKILAGIACLLVLVGGAYHADSAEYLVFDPGGYESSIQGALTALGLTYDVRDNSHPVTAADLATHRALIVGWGGGGGSYSGLSQNVLGTGITGNILITTQDPDFHIVHGYASGAEGNSAAVVAAATRFMQNIIAFAGSGQGTGLVAIPGYSASPFPYLPSEWGIQATGQLNLNEVDFFTPAGLASSLYTGLSASDMSNWGDSYHAILNQWGANFSLFEVAGDSRDHSVTVAFNHSVPEPTTLIFLFAGLLGLIGFRGKAGK